MTNQDQSSKELQRSELQSARRQPWRKPQLERLQIFDTASGTVPCVAEVGTIAFSVIS